MLNRFIPILALCGFCAGAGAAILPPEKLLPKDTLLLATMPDFVAAQSLGSNSPLGRLWQDPALKPFKDKFIDKFTTNVLAPLERNLGVQLSSYRALAQGQATFALLPMTKPSRPDEHFSGILLLDTKDKAPQLHANLADIRQKWAAAGKPMKTRQIRDADFTTLIISSEDLSWDKIMGKPKGADADDTASPPSTNKVELTFGQFDSLLLVSDSVEAIEKVLTRQTGGLLPALEENPAFQSDFAARLRGSPSYAWVNVRESIDLFSKAVAGGGDDANPAANPSAQLATLGLTGLTSASISYRSLPEGLETQFFIGAPEASRRGLIKALVDETKDANPPSFVPADVTKFWRWRLNIPHAWTQIETMLKEFNPQAGNLLNYVLQNAGKEKDDKYDLRSELLGNLGDDIIHYEKAAHGNTLADLNSAPSLYLIGSPNPDKLVAALKNGLSFMGVAKEREFLGRKICTLTSPGQGTAPGHSFSFSGSGGYVGFSSDSDILEEYLRSNDNKGKPLSDTPGLADAAQKVGGMATGFFGFDNQNLSMRAALEMVRQQPITLQDILGAPTGIAGVNTGDPVAKLRDWADFSLLPPYDAISQYFYFSVEAGAFSPEGFTLNYFSPTPPKLR